MDSNSRVTPTDVRGGLTSSTLKQQPSINVRSKRYTPYTKTPGSRKIHGFTRRTTQRQVAADQNLKRFTNKTWRVYQLTPLYKFQHDAASLKRYSKHLSAFLKSESHKGQAFYANEDVNGKAIFTQCKGIPSAKGDHAAVEINITSSNTQGDDSHRMAFTAILCSVGAADFEDHVKLAREFVRLPLLLVKGLVGVTRTTIKWIEQQFDCRVRKITFSPAHLSWMVSMWAGLSDGSTVKPLELMYTMPPEIKGIHDITVRVNHEEARTLWKSFHDEDSDEFTAEEVAAFTQALEAHLFHHFKIYISGLTLKRVGTPLAFIGAEGKLKIFSAEGVSTVLRHMTELAMENTFL